MKSKLLLLLTFSFLLFGCINLGEPSKPISKTGPDAGFYVPPEIKILSPVDLVKTAEDQADVTILIDHANLVLKSPGGNKVAGEGHFQITLAGRDPIKTNSSSYTFEDLKPGTYFLRVELFNNDYTQYNPRVLAVGNFKILKIQESLSPKTHEIQLSKLSFQPKELFIKKGDSVKWKNNMFSPVTILSTSGAFSSFLVYPTGEYSFTFDKEGIYEYSNALYPSMKGKIIVKN